MPKNRIINALLIMAALYGCSAKVDMAEFCDAEVGTSNSLPGLSPHSSTLNESFQKKITSRGSNYVPRTKHMDSNKKALYTNRLILESSPYLLQHAHNPVNWFPWGDEAFQIAKRLKRPILLSVGYSTCHWCHVMEEESFEDIEIAKELNKNYIPIKVDREERPDIDSIYMAAVHAVKGRGGWPMTVWLTPDRRPIYASTYIPARDGDRGVKLGLLSTLKHFKKIYNESPDAVSESTEQISKYVRLSLEKKSLKSTDLDLKTLESIVSKYKKVYDQENGGIIGRTKFPSSLPIQYLLREYDRTKDHEILAMVKTTLDRMASGGIYDHIGGGFHRYAIDSKWKIPHFEKMLYNNALLATAYIEAYQATKDPEYARIAKETIDYVLRDMTSLEGGFFSATDADSKNGQGNTEEGFYFTWTPTEIDKLLNKSESKFIKEYYGISRKGNFENKRTVLSTKGPKSKNRDLLNTLREKLYEQREKRDRPGLDNKILTAWNGLMISALAKAAFVFNDERYRSAAIKATDFIWNNMFIDGRLKRFFADGGAKLNAYLDDYAFYTQALLDTYESTSDLKYFNNALKLDRILSKYYEDKKDGAFYFTSHDHEKLLVKQKPFYDSARPSGNAIAVMNLLRLYKFTTDDSYRARAEAALKSASPTIANSTRGTAELLNALSFKLGSPLEIIIVSPDKKSIDDSKIIEDLRSRYIPNRVISVVTEGDMVKNHGKVIPLLKDKRTFDNKLTAYVCRNGVCRAPANSLADYIKEVERR